MGSSEENSNSESIANQNHFGAGSDVGRKSKRSKSAKQRKNTDRASTALDVVLGLSRLYLSKKDPPHSKECRIAPKAEFASEHAEPPKLYSNQMSSGSSNQEREIQRVVSETMKRAAASSPTIKGSAAEDDAAVLALCQRQAVLEAALSASEQSQFSRKTEQIDALGAALSREKSLNGKTEVDQAAALSHISDRRDIWRKACAELASMLNHLGAAILDLDDLVARCAGVETERRSRGGSSAAEQAVPAVCCAGREAGCRRSRVGSAPLASLLADVLWMQDAFGELRAGLLVPLGQAGGRAPDKGTEQSSVRFF